MAFTMGAGVKRYKLAGPTRKYIGTSGKQRRWVMGRWSFNNPVSATIFGYINGKGHLAYGEATIKRFEEILSMPGMAGYSGFSIFDLAENVPHPTAQAIGRIGNAIKKVSSDIGQLIDDETLKSCGGLNNHTAKETDRYVKFALAYWALEPEIGPAYRYQSERNVQGPNSRNQPFDPF